MSEHVEILVFDHSDNCDVPTSQTWGDIDGPDFCPTCADRGVRYAPAADLEALKADRDRLEEALKTIAAQKLTVEHDGPGDFEFGYDGCVRWARKTLAANGE